MARRDAPYYHYRLLIDVVDADDISQANSDGVLLEARECG
jgi:hypothetical protein